MYLYMRPVRTAEENETEWNAQDEFWAGTWTQFLHENKNTKLDEALYFELLESVAVYFLLQFSNTLLNSFFFNCRYFTLH